MAELQDLGSEEALLGAILVAPGSAKKIDLDPCSFYYESHGRIWEAALKCANNGGADVITVSAELERRGQLEEVGGKDKLAQLAATVPAAGNAKAYAKRITEKAQLRAIRHSAQVLLDAVSKEDEPGIARALEDLGHPIRYLDTSSGEMIDSCPNCTNTRKVLKEKERRITGLELQMSNKREDKEAKARKDPLYDEALGIFDWWRIACSHPDVKFTHEEFELIAPHLRRSKKNGHYHCLEAVAGAAFNPFEAELKNGKVDRKDDWELIFRNRGKLRSFQHRAPKDWRRWLLAWIEAQFK